MAVLCLPADISF